MLEYLAYTVFFIVMFGCLWYIMDSLETEERRKTKSARRASELANPQTEVAH
ncbi:MAG: hypothetical protein J2P50_14960 [Hyphomicrobiaceae bacterium]|nr:hypothetical protein [Hyphomicrobiaceae bacterium]